MTTLRPELLDELLADYETPEDLLGDDGLFKHLKKALLERALGAELSDHLGYERGDPAGRGTGNSRNGHSDKTVLTEDGEVTLAVPRDRNGSFEPVIVPKGERRLDGFDDRILSLYARGMTVHEIQGHLRELYGVAVSPDLISCQRRLKIRPRGGAKDCHLGWWAELGVRLGFGDAVRGFFGGSGQRSHAELKRPAPAGRHGLSGWGQSRHPGLRGASPAGAARRRAAVQLSALFLRARLWLLLSTLC